MRTRDPALDAARGLAIAMMVLIHLVPTAGGANECSRLGTWITALVYDHCASLFCVVAGVAATLWSAPPAVAVRRALALIVLGVVFGRTLWPNEILSPLGLMLLLSEPLRRGGVAGNAVALLVVLAAVPIAAPGMAPWVEADWLEDGRHVAETSIGWVTLRFYLYDGNYPVLPWLAYLILGGLLGQLPMRGSRSPWVLAGCAAIAVGGPFYRAWIEREGEALGDLAPQLAITWVPTSVPYVLWTGATAIAVIGILHWLHHGRGMTVVLRPLQGLGRLSLSHYVLHIALAFTPLRLAYPAEDWSAELGLGIALLYLALAVPASALWLRRFDRGPVEYLFGVLAGRRRYDKSPASL